MIEVHNNMVLPFFKYIVNSTCFYDIISMFTFICYAGTGVILQLSQLRQPETLHQEAWSEKTVRWWPSKTYTVQCLLSYTGIYFRAICMAQYWCIMNPTQHHICLSIPLSTSLWSTWCSRPTVGTSRLSEGQWCTTVNVHQSSGER